MRDVTFDALHLPTTARAATGSGWYDAHAISPERVVVSIGHIAGRGPAVTALKHRLLETFRSGCADKEPAVLLFETVALLRRQNRTRYATAVVGVIDRAAQTFTYSTAGHPPPQIRYANGTIAALPADGLPAALAHTDRPPAQTSVDLRGAAQLLLYTKSLVQADATVDAGLRRLGHELDNDGFRHCANPAGWLAHRMLGDRVHADVALLVATFADGGVITDDTELPRWCVSWSFEATAVSTHAARHAFLECLKSKATTGVEVDLAAAELIFGELLSNVVQHAPGHVDVTLDWSGALPVLHVIDAGPGQGLRGGRAQPTADTFDESGRGLALVDACAERLSVCTAPGGGSHATATLPEPTR